MNLSKQTEQPELEIPVVRRGTTDDALPAWRCFEAHLNWINVSYPVEEVILRRQSVSYTQQIFASYPSAVLELDGVIIGYAACERRDLGVLEIINFYVDDNFRSRGYGARMMEEIERQCVETGFHTLVAFGSDLYYPGKFLPTSLFERLGYEVRSLSPRTEMYVKQLSVDIGEEFTVEETKRVIFRTITRTERVGDNDVMIYHDLEEIRGD